MVVATVAAQTNYYPNTTGTITKSGYTYKYRNERFAHVEIPDGIELYNSTSTYLDVEWAYKDGTKFAHLFGENRPDDFSSSSITRAQTIALIDALFTSQQKTALRGKFMSITVRFNPSTGKIADVYFTFLRKDPFVNIPVEIYRNIELALKERLTIAPTTEGRRLNYIQMYWNQEF